MIYALVDKETLKQKGVSLEILLQHIATFSNIPILQYRNKRASLEEKKEDMETIRAHYDGKLIINDTIELIAYADGLHLGQEDLREYSEDLKEAVELVRQKIGEKILGLSTHDKEEILEANTLDLDYIGLGAYRATDTKREAHVGGESRWRPLHLVDRPLGLAGWPSPGNKPTSPSWWRSHSPL